MIKKENSSIQNFSGNRVISQAALTFDILNDAIELPNRGNILEIGAGKGEFLECFHKLYPQWDINAFEPSASFEILKNKFPKANIQQCEYRDFNYPELTLDLIVALGVLEHVENPLELLNWGNNLLNNNGLFYIRVPNFANNPNDLFCADHLSKLTVTMLKNLAYQAGFDVIYIKEGGVPVFLILKKESKKIVYGNTYMENYSIAENNTLVARKSMEAIVKARINARNNGEKFAIFGLGSSGLFAPFYAGFDVNEITAYIDENKTLAGTKVHGIDIVGLDFIDSLKIKHVALAVSPVYFDKIKDKLKGYNVNVYHA